MRRKIDNHTQWDLRWLVNFLNMNFGKRGTTIITGGVWLGQDAAATDFIKTYAAGKTNEVIRIQRELHDYLTRLVAPESLVTRVKDPKIKRIVMKNLVPSYGDPEERVGDLVYKLNALAVQPRWQYQILQGKEAHAATLKIRGISMRVFKWDLLKNLEGRLYYPVARLFESGKLMDLRRCRVCSRFYVINRPWQKDCSRACKKKFDSQTSAETKKSTKGKQQQKEKKGRKVRRKINGLGSWRIKP